MPLILGQTGTCGTPTQPTAAEIWPPSGSNARHASLRLWPTQLFTRHASTLSVRFMNLRGERRSRSRNPFPKVVVITALLLRHFAFVSPSGALTGNGPHPSGHTPIHPCQQLLASLPTTSGDYNVTRSLPLTLFFLVLVLLLFFTSPNDVSSPSSLRLSLATQAVRVARVSCNMSAYKSWSFDIDRHLNPFIPAPPWHQLPTFVSRWFGYRKDKPVATGNLMPIFWAFIGIFFSVATIEAVSGHIPSFHDHGAPLIVGSFVSTPPSTDDIPPVRKQQLIT